MTMIFKNKFITRLAIKPQFPFFHLDDRIHGKAIWPFIFLSVDEPSRSLIEHEKIHLRQQLRGFLIFFYIKYFYYHFKYGYNDNPYEVEAYKHQDDWYKEEQ